MTQMDADEQERKERCGMAEDDDPLTYAIIGAAMEVHRQLGQGSWSPCIKTRLRSNFAFRWPAQRRRLSGSIEVITFAKRDTAASARLPSSLFPSLQTAGWPST
jgi:hypothetical protein